MSVTSTLHVNLRGNAREALEFYHSVFGGEIVAVPYGDAPAGQSPRQSEEIAWGQVISPSGFHVMAYDVQDDLVYDPGHHPYYFALRGTDADEITGYWEALRAAASHVEVELGPSIFSPLYGKLTDRFGVTWIREALRAAASHVEVELGPSIFSPLYGKLTDRFGVTWIIDVIVPWNPADASA